MPSSDVAPWPRHGKTCLCYACSRRRRKLARRASIEPRRLVSADEARAHVDELVARGWRRIDVARAAGCSPALISKLAHEGATINESSAQSILSVVEA